jgi:hypothetical protein
LPDVRLRTSESLWNAESSFGQQSPQPGRPTPQRDTEALLLASGQQQATQELDLLCIDGGPVGRTAEAAQVVWKKATDGANSYRGREIPVTLSSWQFLDEVSGTGYTHPDVVTLTQAAYAGDLVVVAQDKNTEDIVCFRRTTDGTLTGPTVIHDASARNKAGITPCLVEVGDRLFCLFWCHGQGSGVTAPGDREFQIRVLVSEDGGTTWEIARKQATTFPGIVNSLPFTDTDIYQPRDMKAAFANGQVCVCVHFWRNSTSTQIADHLGQWASSNLGTYLELVSFSATQNPGRLSLVEHAGRFVLGFIQAIGGEMWVGSSASAYEPLLEAAQNTNVDFGDDNVLSGPARQLDADLTLVSDDLGLLFAVGRVINDTVPQLKNGHIVAYMSDDDAKTWSPIGIDELDAEEPGAIFAVGKSGQTPYADAYLRQLVGTYQGGRLVLVHQPFATTATLDDSLCLAYLGGFSDLTTAPVTQERAYRLRMSWVHTLLPFERAQDLTMWTPSASPGTFTNTLVGGFELVRNGDGASSGLFSVAATTGLTVGGDHLMCATFAAHGKNTGASATTPTTAFTFRVDDTAVGVELGLYLDETSFGIYDRVSSAQLALVSGLANEPREWRVAVFSDETATTTSARVWYRSWDMTTDRRWTDAGSYTLTDDGGTVGSARVAFGAFSSVVSPADIELYSGPHWTTGNKERNNCRAGTEITWDEWVTASNPDELSGTPLSTEPFELEKGLSLRAIDGPAFAGDEWALRPSYAFPVERVWTSYARSSRVRWRSVDDTVQQAIAVAFDPTLLGTDESHPGAPLYGLWLDGINWRTGELQAYAGGAWVKVADIDASDAFGSINYTRDGATILPNNDTDNQIAGQELVGWDWRPTTGGIVRRIKGNRGGRWATGATAGPRVRVHVDKVEASDPSSGSCYLSSRSVCIVFDHLAADTASGWRVVIDAQDTLEGFFEIGTMTLGPVWVSGQVPDWGRVLDQRLGTAYAVRQDGTATGVRQTPASYAVDVAWTAGVDVRQFHDGTAEPTYVQTSQAAGVEGAATWAGTVYDLQHELDALGALPLVYLPKLEGDVVSGVRTLTRWFELYPARVADGLNITSAYGNEGTDETFTVGTVTLEPEL